VARRITARADGVVFPEACICCMAPKRVTLKVSLNTPQADQHAGATLALFVATAFTGTAILLRPRREPARSVRVPSCWRCWRHVQVRALTSVLSCVGLLVLPIVGGLWLDEQHRVGSPFLVALAGTAVTVLVFFLTLRLLFRGGAACASSGPAVSGTGNGRIVTLSFASEAFADRFQAVNDEAEGLAPRPPVERLAPPPDMPAGQSMCPGCKRPRLPTPAGRCGVCGATL
jgi:hypothetical protein